MSVPEGLSLPRHRDLVGRDWRPLVRRILLAALTTVLVLGLLNVFGQRPTTTTAAASTGELEVSAPTKLRSGLYFQARFRFTARTEVEDAVLVLSRGWLEGITLNTVEPAPLGEASRDGSIAFSLGRIPAGDEHLLYLHFQVNPTTLGRRAQDVALLDGERRLVSIERTTTIWP